MIHEEEFQYEGESDKVGVNDHEEHDISTSKQQHHFERQPLGKEKLITRRNNHRRRNYIKTNNNYLMDFEELIGSVDIAHEYIERFKRCPSGTKLDISSHHLYLS